MPGHFADCQAYITTEDADGMQKSAMPFTHVLLISIIPCSTNFYIEKATNHVLTYTSVTSGSVALNYSN